MKPVRHAFALVCLTLLAACEVFGVPRPETFNQRVAFVQASVTEVRNAATNLLQADAIKVDDAQNVQDQADTARRGIDIAVAVHATDPNQAENRLEAAQVIVDALKAYLGSVQP